MKRFRLVGRVLLLCLGVTLFHAMADGAPAASKRPNILFLLSDDHSYPYLGCYGNRTCKRRTWIAWRPRECDWTACSWAVRSACRRKALMTGRSPVAARMVRSHRRCRRTCRRPTCGAGPAISRARPGVTITWMGCQERANMPPEIDAAIKKHGLHVYQPRGLGCTRRHEEFRRFVARCPHKLWFFWLGFSDPHHPWDTQGPRGLPEPNSRCRRICRTCRACATWAHIAEVEHLTVTQDVLQTLERRLCPEHWWCSWATTAWPCPWEGSLYDPGIAVPLVALAGPGELGGVTNSLSPARTSPDDARAVGVAAQEMSGVSYLKLPRRVV